MKNENEPNAIATYVGLYLFIQGVLCVGVFFFMMYQILFNERRIDFGGIVFLIITASISLLGGYKIIKRYS